MVVSATGFPDSEVEEDEGTESCFRSESGFSERRCVTSESGLLGFGSGLKKELFVG